MGHTVQATCRSCGHMFELSHGNGFHFHLLRCDRCGRIKTVSFEEIKALHKRYLKERVSPEKYFSKVERHAGKCTCEGQFAFDAPARCPKCRSTDLEEGNTILLFN